jgi:predicted RND superfamily exporter protein
MLSFVVMSLIATGALNIKSKWSTKAWYDDDHIEMTKLADFESQFGSDSFISIGVSSKDGLINRNSLQMIKDISEELWQVSDVIRVESLANHNVIKADGDDVLINPLLGDESEVIASSQLKQISYHIKNDKIISDFFLNNDRTFSMIYGYLKPDFDNNVDYSKIEKEVESIVSGYRKNGVNIYITGTVPTNNAFKEVARSDNFRILPFSLFFMMLLLFLFFKRYLTLVLFVILSGTTIVCTMSLLGHFNLYYNSFLTVVPGVMLAICTADIIHILSSYYRNRDDGDSIEDSMIKSLEKNLLPTILTTVSTATSFASLMISDIAPIRDLGALSACGALLAWAATYFLIAPTVVILEKYCRQKVLRKVKNTNTTSRKYTDALADFIYSYRYLVIIMFSGITLVSFLIASTNEVNSDPMSFFDNSVKLKKAYNVTENKMKGIRGVELVIDSGKEEGAKDPVFLDKVNQYISWLKHESEVVKVQSIIDVIKKMNQSLHGDDERSYVIPSRVNSVAENLLLYSIGLPANKSLNNLITLDNRKIRLRLTWTVSKSKEGNVKIDNYIRKANEIGIVVIPSGNAPVNLSMNDEIVNSFFSSMFMAILFVSLLLLIVYKNILIGFISLLPNIIPLCVGGAVIKLMGYSIDIGTSIVCTVCLGIAIDDTIHFVSSFQKNVGKKLSIIDQIKETFLITGRALIITTILLVVGFGSFIFADFIPNRNFGILCSIILSMALVTDLLFLPALLIVADEIKAYSFKTRLTAVRDQLISSMIND